MNERKKRIISASIDLFAEHGYMNVSNAMIAQVINTARSDINYHFEKGKQDIVRYIVQLFDEIIKSNTKNTIDWNAIRTDTDSILSYLFYTFREEDSEICRKINRILYHDQFYVSDIQKYMTETIIGYREARLFRFFDNLIQQGIIKPFNTKMAAKMLNDTLNAVAFEDAHLYPYEKNKLPTNLVKAQKTCKFIIDLIAYGRFP